MDESQGKSKSLTILQKLKIIEMVEGGESVKEVAEKMRINRNTLHYILKNRDKISEASKKPGLSCHKRIKQTKNPELESIILNYIFKAKENGEKLTGSIIKAVALETSLNMNCNNFAASNGWLFSFLKRNDITMSDLNSSKQPSAALGEYEPIKEDETTIVYEEVHGIEDSSTANIEMKEPEDDEEELEVIIENENEMQSQIIQINWRDWCRLCGSTEPVYKLHSELLDIVKHLLSTINSNEDINACGKCNTSLDEISKLIYKGKLIESMFSELEEREKMNCLTVEGVSTIRQEYGIEETSTIKQPLEIEEEISEISYIKEDDNTIQQELETGEIDYLEEEEDEEMEYNHEIMQLQEYEIVEQSMDGENVEEQEELHEEEGEIISEEYSTIENENLNSKLLREEEMYTYTCHICSENFERMCFLTNHTRQQHDCLPQVACTCGKLLSTWESLMNHKRKHSTEVGEWQCGLCGTRFVTKTGLSIHIKFKHEKERKRHDCKICGKEFKDAQMLKNHERSHLPHEQKFQVECDICQKKLSSKYSLRHHIASVHEQQKTIICHLCSKAFSNRSNLKSHLISHSTENVKCDICNSTFKNRVSLQSHKKIHKPKELLNFSCSECDKRFHNRNHLERHMISHSDARNFKCTIEGCNMSYKWEKDLKNHLAIHNGEKENKCPWCDNSFVDVGNLRKHKLKYHPKELAEFESKYGKGRKMKMLA